MASGIVQNMHGSKGHGRTNAIEKTEGDGWSRAGHNGNGSHQRRNWSVRLLHWMVFDKIRSMANWRAGEVVEL